MILDGISACACDLGRVHHGHSSTLAGQFENCDGQLRQITKKDALALDLALQPLFLPLQASLEGVNPRIPILLIGSDRALCPPQCKIISAPTVRPEGLHDPKHP
ncbi:hypothetical protein NOJ05_25120 [Neorhizobium galegae]|uniref:hypothetical protein n=1 Tax=Neorhizobium galegae TaxID=399 RepID=UPI002107FFAE|nr:hypothetical protein [Neorhizobium galegae]MCQ1780507.1 hypothetical protein [Neorhizobium galegae]MCQ1797613.1 hypothetical protein [Neorhizobium galegae]